MSTDILNRIKKGSITVRRIIYTSLGAAINFFLLFDSIPKIFMINIRRGILPLDEWLFFCFSVFAVSLFIALSSSLSFREKVFISPLDIQVLTIVFLILFGFPRYVENYSYLLIDALGFLVLFLVGRSQDSLLTILIGISGTANACYLKSFVSEKNIDDVKDALIDQYLKESFGITTVKKENDAWIFHNPSGASYRNFIYLKKHPDYNDRAVINLIVYYKSRYLIEKRETCEHYVTMYSEVLKGTLPLIEIKDDIKYKNESLEIALRPTENRLFKFMSSKTFWIFVGVTIVDIIAYLLHLSGNLEYGNLVGLVFASITFVISLLRRGL